MTKESPLPPGQYESADFPRFGLTPFARRFPRNTSRVELRIEGEVPEPITVSEELRELPRVHQTSDFHCVTTWSRRALRWEGFRFADLYERIIVPRASPDPKATFVVFRCQDGYRAGLLLEDLLAADVLLADTLDDQPLTIEHGAPLRLVAPAHYGYKNPKHVSRIELWRDPQRYHPAGFRFMDHPRARVALEERGRVFPGVFLRYLYRPLIRPTVKRFRRAMEEYHATTKTHP